ncbi:SMP-30/gluconolactonase/LRE family protein [Algoriphagus halophytocola]|uniref:SMP-30/gluconolactonase/LRE family protein n=1 Tax=Algoriphagus halophytocola TaxID=2991499 RepID=A0ABY6MI56_9BACT|nr:SMP-30/gluconolactonase/LRE family protein [Algoriphagus sp. TR-M5]UZD22664.1 SMP-30/gluconolactonase/LRE family protein [Algoriphagus sp. TR-M5]
MKKIKLSVAVFSVSILLILACAEKVKKEEDSKGPQVGSLRAESEDFYKLISKDAQIEVLAAGFDWTEGPLWLESEQALIFSDVPQNKVWKWSEEDSISLYLEPSGYLGDREGKREPGSNGLILDHEGNLILCQHGERRIAKMLAPIATPTADYEELTGAYEGDKFNSPNDLVMNQSEQLFFTDPPYGLDDWDPKELDFQGVYRLDQSGELILLIDSLSRPNGIGLSPDERTLYVAQSDPGKARYYAYTLDEKGKVTSGKILLDATGSVGSGKPGLPDGLTVDKAGNLFASGPGGIWVISAEGDHLGTIVTGQNTSNCTFDTEENYLYMTADNFLMRIKMK